MLEVESQQSLPIVPYFVSLRGAVLLRYGEVSVIQSGQVVVLRN